MSACGQCTRDATASHSVLRDMHRLEFHMVRNFSITWGQNSRLRLSYWKPVLKLCNGLALLRLASGRTNSVWKEPEASSKCSIPKHPIKLGFRWMRGQRSTYYIRLSPAEARIPTRSFVWPKSKPPNPIPDRRFFVSGLSFRILILKQFPAPIKNNCCALTALNLCLESECLQ